MDQAATHITDIINHAAAIAIPRYNATNKSPPYMVYNYRITWEKSLSKILLREYGMINPFAVPDVCIRKKNDAPYAPGEYSSGFFYIVYCSKR